MNLKYINSCNDDLVVKLRGEIDTRNCIQICPYDSFHAGGLFDD